jgi:hypothetical protein
LHKKNRAAAVTQVFFSQLKLKKMFTEKDLIAGETVLTWKEDKRKVLYLGSAGLVHFISRDNEFKKSSGCYFTIDDLNEFLTIEQPKSNTVPLEKKVYDFVPVRCRDDDGNVWHRDNLLIAVVPNAEYPYKVLSNLGSLVPYKQCEFINEQ